jgi:hypothetical protein
MKKFAVFTLILAVAMTFSFAAKKKTEETDAEKAIPYPITGSGRWHNKFVDIEFSDGENLTITARGDIPLQLNYKYKLQKLLYTHRQNYTDMRLCGIRLTVTDENGNSDIVDFTRKGDFSKSIDFPDQYRCEYKTSRLYIADYFNDNSWASNLSSVYIDKLDMEIRQAREKQREKDRQHHGGVGSSKNEH